MTEAPYAVERVAAPPAIRAEMDRLAALHAGGAGRSLLGGLAGIGFVLAVVYGAIALIDLVFGVIDRAHWLVLTMGSAIILTPVLLIQLRDARLSRPDRDAAAAALRGEAQSGEVLRHTLHRDARHWFVAHEHGVIHLCPADAARTLFLDISSVAGDPRHEAWFATGRLHRAEWTWFTTRDGRFLLGFEALGAPLAPNDLDAAAGGYDPEIGGEVFEFLGSPGDGDVVDRPFAAVDDMLRRRIAAPR